MASFEAEFDEGMRGSSLLIWLVAGTLALFVGWAYFASIDEIVRADGEFVSSSKPQIIQNLEGGILSELLVAEGDEVEQGEILARLRGTKFQSSVDDLSDQIDALEIRKLRLQAELEGAFDFDVPATLAIRQPNIVDSERALLRARQSDYVSRTDGARAVLAQARKERDLMEAMLKKQIVSLIEVTRSRKAFSDAEIQVNEIATKAELDRAAEYSDTLKEIATLQANVKAAEDQLNRTVIRSPMKGIVNNLGVSTIGGVVRPGEEIFQIIPLDEELFVEAQVAPKDIANLKRGQSATIKLSAYDYTIYGSLDGEVHLISADTFKDERRPEIEPHYRVSLRVDLDNLTDRQKRIEIRPGMQAEVELHTGEKTVLQYLLKPLYKSKEAFREP